MVSCVQLNDKIANYTNKCVTRDRVILSLLLFLLIAAILSAFYKLMPLLFVVLGNLFLLALLIAFSSRTWHKDNGVFCHNCGYSFAPSEELYSELDRCLSGDTSSVYCPSCKVVVAQRI